MLAARSLYAIVLYARCSLAPLTQAGGSIRHTAHDARTTTGTLAQRAAHTQQQPQPHCPRHRSAAASSGPMTTLAAEPRHEEEPVTDRDIVLLHTAATADDDQRHGASAESTDAPPGPPAEERISLPDVVGPPSSSPAIPPLSPRLSLLDRLLTLWILLAMVLGILIGYFSPAAAAHVDSWTFGSARVNLPIAIGLIIMMWPPLARVRYDKLAWWRSASADDSLAPDCAPGCVAVRGAAKVPATTDPESQQRISGAAAAAAPSSAAGTAIDGTAPSAAGPPSVAAPSGAASSHRRALQLLGICLFFNWIISPFLMWALALGCLPDHPSLVRGLVYVGLAPCIGQ